MVARIRPTAKVEPIKPTEQYGQRPAGIYSKAICCKHCEQWYINPCLNYEDCANYIHLQSKKGRRK